MKYKCGYSPSQIKKIFMKKTHYGQCWNKKAKFNIFKSTVSIGMEGNERLIYNLKTGIGKRTDLDADGCSFANNFEFIIGPSQKSRELTILRNN